MTAADFDFEKRVEHKLFVSSNTNAPALDWISSVLINVRQTHAHVTSKYRKTTPRTSNEHEHFDLAL